MDHRAQPPPPGHLPPLCHHRGAAAPRPPPAVIYEDSTVFVFLESHLGRELCCGVSSLGTRENDPKTTQRPARGGGCRAHRRGGQPRERWSQAAGRGRGVQPSRAQPASPGSLPSSPCRGGVPRGATGGASVGPAAGCLESQSRAGEFEGRPRCLGFVLKLAAVCPAILVQLPRKFSAAHGACLRGPQGPGLGSGRGSLPVGLGPRAGHPGFASATGLHLPGTGPALPEPVPRAP